ncbi:(Fe-S)-binding protein [Thermoproteus tenax]|uniref:Fe-S oxidoreductase, putative glycolate oxidase subunit n=1 Tax=Thermoproteus tenax (strain ATCC 35583 / DSM 2078 / JCM 9277 / NBRC 100435 / Kra 1) TaxID=768679 RepID=G4RP38_THETK|nr:(Fe-S)-binding protein [Thermoproteus tenax]CCC81333.1 Fe-S oxidoreductase, putative glycolate oxidase subunit [Thermoproteus tenax Kra 1]
MISEIDKCARCGFCEAVCPTYNALRMRHLGPRGRLHMARLALADGRASKYVVESIETCLRCRACELVCPVSIKIVDVITAARRRLREAT